MQKRSSPVMSAGGSSVLVIFVVLALATFSVLSLAAARADLRFALRRENTFFQQQQAEAQAETTLAQIGEALFPLWEGGRLSAETAKQALSALPAAVFEAENGFFVSFTAVFEEAQVQAKLFFDAAYSGSIRSALVLWQAGRIEETDGEFISIPD